MTHILPVVHTDCCKSKCVHIYIPKNMKTSPFAGGRCCLPTDGKTISAMEFQDLTNYTSLIKNRIPSEDRKIGTRHCVPIFTERQGDDLRIRLTSYRDVIYNIAEKWLRANSDPNEWVGGQKALEKWLVAHLKYLTTNPIDLGTLSRKMCFVTLLDKEQEQAQKKQNRRKKPPQREEEEEEDEEDETKGPNQNEKQKQKQKQKKPKNADVYVYNAKYGYAADVEIKQSTIPNAGQGVFALVNMRQKQIIGRYGGKIISRERMLEMPKQDMNKVISLVLPSGIEVLVDGKECNHFSAFFNHKWKQDKNPLGAANIGVTGEGYFVCLRDITAGEELWFDYGPKYWAFQDLGIDVDELEDTAKQLEIMQTVYKNRPN